tara:strand:- start:175 stop:429 length:255 start_codon:yes stop_codon:yes gene_type:complete
MSENPKNLYQKSYDQGAKLKNLGFDYHEEDIVLKRTMMPRLFQNEVVAGFLRYINNVMVNNIDSVKIIRNFFNYTVKKNDTNIN